MSRDRIDAYLQTRAGDFEEQLKDLLRIPSVSAQPAHDADTRKAARFVHDDLAAMGLKTEIVQTKRHPIVYAERLNAPGKPTVLVYGHYDVQPPEPLEPWLQPDPFEPVVRDGNVYARGATDDKGQMFTHLKAAEAWLKTVGELPVNVKFLIEGEEEIGGENLEEYVASNKAKLACDYAVISDTSQFAPGKPAITYGLKGLAYFEIHVRGANRDLHSGTYGGAVANPLNAMAEILASLKGPDGRVRVKGFYDAVRPLTDSDRRAFADLPFSEEEFRADLGVTETFGEQGYSTLERKGARPTCDVHGVWGGYSGDGPKTVLPREAGAKFSFRLVPDQDPAEIARLVREHVAANTPPGVTVELVSHMGSPGIVVDVASPGFRAASRAIEAAFGVAPLYIREGGSIPVVGLLKKHLDVDTLLLGWGQNDDNLHGPNEKFSLADFHRGIKAGAYLLDELSRAS